MGKLSHARVGGLTGGLTRTGPTYPNSTLALPDGTVRYTFGGTQLYVHTPSCSPLAAGQPTIQGLSWNANGTLQNGTLHLTGTRYNGISEGENSRLRGIPLKP